MVLVIACTSCAHAITWCKEKKTWIAGTPIWEGSVAKISECQKKCAQDSSCHAFNFDWKDVYCWLHTNTAIENVWPADGKISKFKDGESPRCGGPIPDTTVQATTTQASKATTKATTTTQASTSTQAPTTTQATTTAQQQTGGDYCKEYETWIDGDVIQDGWARSSSSVEDCEATCNAEPACDAYTFGGYCWLYPRSGVNNVYAHSAGKISGFKRGTSDRCSGSGPVDPTTQKPTTAQTTKVTDAGTDATAATTTKKATTRATGDCAATTDPKYDYGEVIDLSLQFYEAQRSGKLPADNRISYRGDSALNDGKPEGHDLSGGYYDAGDNVKFGFPMAGSMTVLAWGMIDYKDAYQCAGQLDWAYKTIKWGTDWFIKAHVSDNKLYGQCGDGGADHSWWGRPEDMTMNRPCWAISESCPGSDLAGETAASLASAAILFEGEDDAYSQKCLSHAKTLYAFAMNKKGAYHNCITDAGNFYKSWSGYWDELAWAAAWLYKATGDEKYRKDADSIMTSHGLLTAPNEFSWDKKTAGAQVLMYELTGDSKYITGAQEFCKKAANPNQTPTHTPKGLPYYSQWGSLRYAANAAFICLQVGENGVDANANKCFAKNTIGYMLGDAGRSYVVGYGTNPPKRPHHKASSCPTTGSCGWNELNTGNPNPQTLYGALVGGPNSQDGYSDDRTDYESNEVATDYNAGFTSALAGLSTMYRNEEVNC